MVFEIISQNILREEQIIAEMSSLYRAFNSASLPEGERKNAEESINLLESQLKILNNALPEIINSAQFYKPLDSAKSETPAKNLVAVKYTDESGGKSREINLAIKKKEEMKFLEKLSLHKLLSRKNREGAQEPVKSAAEKYSRIITLANRLFKNTSNNLVQKGYFNALKTNLIKTTSPLIVTSYVSIMLFVSLASVFVGLLAGILLFALGLVSIIPALLIILLTPIAVFFIFYYAPSSKRKSLEKEINQELPFLVIYMAAISTSGIEPSKVFNILLSSKDYPVTQREVKKLVNYINFYGYDIVTSLKMTARNSPSDRLGQLFDGLATTITSGGDLPEFLSKHSESLLFDYRLEREKYTHVAETFMNIYISVVIAAPMIMMMVFILMSLTGFASGYLSPANIGILTVLIISFLNLAFLVFLNMKQPKF